MKELSINNEHNNIRDDGLVTENTLGKNGFESIYRKRNKKKRKSRLFPV